MIKGGKLGGVEDVAVSGGDMVGGEAVMVAIVTNKKTISSVARGHRARTRILGRAEDGLCLLNGGARVCRHKTWAGG